jgi:hypothetical protein
VFSVYQFSASLGKKQKGQKCSVWIIFLNTRTKVDILLQESKLSDLSFEMSCIKYYDNLHVRFMIVTILRILRDDIQNYLET